jgi:hypothetical protein
MRRRARVRLTAALVVSTGLQSSAGAALPDGFAGSFDWQMADPRFGGLSSIEMADDGLCFTAMSDRGTLITGRLARDAAGAITAVTDTTILSLKGARDAPLDSALNDTEGLAVAGDGTVFVSLEGPARVLRYDRADGPAANLPTPDAFRAMQRNSALEALAIDAQGWLYTLPERSGTLDGPFPVYRFRDGAWDQPFSLPRDGLYLAVAADVGPDGRLYLLERQFHGLLGFQSRVRRFVVTGDTVGAGEVVLETATGQHGNQEGLSVWRDAAGSLRLTMVSDDNFRFFLRTSLVEYRIPD